MPEAILSLEAWEAVKAASIKGVPDSQLAESFGINGNAIRQRRFLDPVWKAAVNAKREAVEETKQKSEVVSCGLTGDLTKGENAPSAASLARKVASTISENASSLSENNLLLANQLAQKGIQRALSAIDGVEIENMADIERAVKIAAVAGKWSQPIVNVNQAFAFGGGQEDQNIIECDMEIMEDSNNYGDSFNL